MVSAPKPYQKIRPPFARCSTMEHWKTTITDILVIGGLIIFAGILSSIVAIEVHMAIHRHWPCRGGAAMTDNDRAVLEGALRITNDLSDVLRAIAVAAKLVGEKAGAARGPADRAAGYQQGGRMSQLIAKPSGRADAQARHPRSRARTTSASPTSAIRR